MNFHFVLCLLLLMPLTVSAAEDQRLKLTPLKPFKIAPKHIGRIKGELMNSADEKVLDEITADLGDCAGCARGIAVKGVLGIRFEGDSLRSLRVVKKSTTGVHYRDCKQPELAKGQDYSCTFTFGSSTYTVKLVSMSKTKRKRAK